MTDQEDDHFFIIIRLDFLNIFLEIVYKFNIQVKEHLKIEKIEIYKNFDNFMIYLRKKIDYYINNNSEIKTSYLILKNALDACIEDMEV